MFVCVVDVLLSRHFPYTCGLQRIYVKIEAKYHTTSTQEITQIKEPFKLKLNLKPRTQTLIKLL